MSWPQMIEKPTVTIYPDGQVVISEGEFKHATCRQAAQLGMAWAIEKLGAALVEDMSADEPQLCARD